MARSSDINFPIKMIKAHNKIIEDAASDYSREKVSKTIFEALRQSFYETTDAVARSHPNEFHHVYEWNDVGGERLYKLTAAGRGTSGFVLSYDFLKSKKPVPNSPGHVFTEKAFIMEEQIPVTIEPVASDKLAFEIDGEKVFTEGPVEVDNPGGEATYHAMKNHFSNFFSATSINANPAVQMAIDLEKKRVMNALKRARI